jgi:hypothetical protein
MEPPRAFISTTASYSDGPRFEFQPGDWLFWLPVHPGESYECTLNQAMAFSFPSRSDSSFTEIPAFVL